MKAGLDKSLGSPLFEGDGSNRVKMIVTNMNEGKDINTRLGNAVHQIVNKRCASKDTQKALLQTLMANNVSIASLFTSLPRAHEVQ